MKKLQYIYFVPVAALIASGAAKLIQPPPVVEAMKSSGVTIPLVPLGVVELLAAIAMIVPMTRNVGFLLCTAYLGGVIAVEWSASGLPVPGVVLQTLLWVGWYCRSPETFAFGK